MVERDLLHAEEFAVPLTLLLLLFVFGSLVAAAMPVTIGAVAVVGTLLVLRILNGITPVSIYAVNLTTVLGLGLAIDYSLFIVSRFREELAGRARHAAALEETLAHAGRTVAGSALTMAAAAGALFVFPLVFLRSFAYSGIAVVLLAGAAALVVLPAVLALLGPRINSLTVWRRSVRPPLDGFWSRIGPRASCGDRSLVIVAVAVVLAVMAAPFVHLRLGYLDDRVLAPSDQVRQVDDTLRAEFGQGQTDALQVVVPRVGATTAAEQAAYAARLSLLPAWRASMPPVASTQRHPLRWYRPVTWPNSTGRRDLVLGRPQWATACPPGRSARPRHPGRTRAVRHSRGGRPRPAWSTPPPSSTTTYPWPC